MARSKRKAREAALQTLYEIEVGKTHEVNALHNTLEAADLPEDVAAYARRLTEGVRQRRDELDGYLSPLVQGYELSRLAAIDRNILRIAAYELYHEPAVPPKVTINEAIEVAKKYSTAESGRFVNGVLGKLVGQSPKGDWDPSTAPREEIEEVFRDSAEPEIEDIEVDQAEAERLAKVGGWKLRSE